MRRGRAGYTRSRHLTLNAIITDNWMLHQVRRSGPALNQHCVSVGYVFLTGLFLPHPRVKVSIVESLRDRKVACSASDRQDANFESCAWRTVSSQSSHHPQEVLLAQLSLYVHKGGLKPDSFHFILFPDWARSVIVVFVSNWCEVH